MLWSVVWVLGGWGEFRQVIFGSAELLRLPGVGEGFCVLFWVAEHFAQPGVAIGAVHGGVDVVRKGRLVLGPE